MDQDGESDSKAVFVEISSGSGLTIRRVSIADLHNDPANVRLHDQRNLDAITASLKTFGQVEPLVVQKGTNKVIGGNGRLAAMKAMGLTECDVVELEADNVTATALGIALNRTAELASWDEEALSKQIEALQADGFDDFQAVGFSDEDMAPMSANWGDQSTDDGSEESDQGGESSGPESEAPAPSFTGTLKYELIFDGVEQQARWFKFVRWLKSQVDMEAETVAGRLDKFLAAYGPADLA